MARGIISTIWYSKLVSWNNYLNFPQQLHPIVVFSVMVFIHISVSFEKITRPNNVDLLTFVAEGANVLIHTEKDVLLYRKNSRYELINGSL